MSDLPLVAGKPTVLGVDATLPIPSCVVLDVDDFTGWSLSMEFVSASGNTIKRPGARSGEDIWFFALSDEMRSAPAYWQTFVNVTTPEGSYVTPTPPVAVVDYSALWATPWDVDPMGEYSPDQVVLAILAAEGAVRAWVSTPVPTPAPERVRRAVALLGSRALTEPSASGDLVLGETIGDYSIRYADPGASSGLFVNGAIAELLEPWSHGRAYSVHTPPVDWRRRGA